MNEWERKVCEKESDGAFNHVSQTGTDTTKAI